MATQKQLDEIQNKMLSDATFKEEFAESPEAVAKKLNIHLTPGQVIELKQLAEKGTLLSG
jgi:hypothetical protein